MIIYRKKLILKIILGVFSIVFLLLGICLSANAQESIKVYNKDKEVVLSHDLFSYDEQYYLHLDDLGQLGLSVNKENGKYTITSADGLGVERTLIISPKTLNTDFVITPLAEEVSSEENTISVKTVTCHFALTPRSTKKIGYSTGFEQEFPLDSIYLNGYTQALINDDGELYISTQFIGNELSHKYSLENGRMDFYIADADSVIMETTVNLAQEMVVPSVAPSQVPSFAPSGGHDVNIYTAYKTGEGNTLEDFEMLSSLTCTIPENESSVTCLIEIPIEKINTNNIYFIADLGETYVLACNEYDFSKVGKVLVYGQQDNITYTVNVNLPAVDELDVPFTVYVKADSKTFSKQGVVKSGEKSAIFKFEGLPAATDYNARIEFGYHKYRNSVLVDFMFVNIAYAKDFKTDFTAEYSRVVACNVSLPDDFIPDGDVEVKVELSKYISFGGIAVVDRLIDWHDSKIITLNNEKRSEQIYLYSQSSSSRLSYWLVSPVDGLCEKGYLCEGGLTSNKVFSKEIEEDLDVKIKLLRKKKITVTVFRPYFVPIENDIFATVELDNLLTSDAADIIMDFTKTPLIPSGDKSSQFEFEIAEDESYTLEISNITGDDQLFDYYCYVKPSDSPADKGRKCIIGFSDDDIDTIELLKANIIKGTVKCEKQDLHFDVFATCKTCVLDKTIILTTKAENGEFSFKIPGGIDTYILSVQTRAGKKSFYVSDGLSTNNENEATKLEYDNECENDKVVVLEYILQNPPQPIEISDENDYFRFENVSDYLIDEYDAYVAYYDKHGKLISVDKTEENKLVSGWYFKLQRNTADYKIKKAKAFAWKKGSLIPLGNISEISVNQPYIPEQNISVFRIGDINAVINSKVEVLHKAPENINDTMYILTTDFERMGYKVIVFDEVIYIERDELKFEFIPGEYTAVQKQDDVVYDISAPILREEEILIPVSVVSNLFDEKPEYHNMGKMLIINMPFCDIKYNDVFCKPILTMYNKGVIEGDEDGAFNPSKTVLRSEAAAFFSRTMRHEFVKYEFECADVPASHWAKSWIGICINENIFSLENNMFRPNDCITLKEAIIATLKMLGENFENYLETAKERGLLTNINEENVERNITRAEITQLLYNSLEVDN